MIGFRPPGMTPKPTQTRDIYSYFAVRRARYFRLKQTSDDKLLLFFILWTIGVYVAGVIAGSL